MFRFKQTQRFRVVSGSVCFYATAKQIRTGLGDFTRFNAAVQKAVDALEGMRNQDESPVGLAGTWENISVQIDVAQK